MGKKIIGIDTGGTYTDIVVICSDTKKILYKAKTLTTRYKLKRCIEDSFAGISEDILDGVSMVCLSTTLATNAIVENHGCKEGLILIGSRPQGKMPTDRVKMVKGKYDIMGRMKENIDAAEVNAAIESFRGNVDAIAVSGYASVRNPAHEIFVKQMIEQKLDIPVVCAHELTAKLGYYERTVTADLNARLIPMVCDLMDSVRAVLEKYKIDAPLMVVKGDGSLMPDVMARSKPIETIMSGPAASVMGGVALSGMDNMFVLDMGGTTTDIADVRDGFMKIRNEGARVGDWITHVKATEVYTMGLGGDSRICLDSERNIQLGPEKSIPVSMAGERYPELMDEIDFIWKNETYKTFRYQDEEAYFLVKKYDKLSYTDEEDIIIEVVRYVPHTLHYLQNHIHMKHLRKLLRDLCNSGVLARISLTPTDILHVTGEYVKWNSDIAKTYVDIYASQCGLTPVDFINKVAAMIIRKLDCACIQASMYFDHQQIDMEEGGAADYFLNKLFFDDDSEMLGNDYYLKQQVVAIGAPAGAWASRSGRCLHADVIVPENAEVANALGAAVGRMIEEIEILIRPNNLNGGFIVYSPASRKCFKSLTEATECAEEAGRNCVHRFAGSEICSLSTKIEDVNIEGADRNEKVFVERIVTVFMDFSKIN